METFWLMIIIAVAFGHLVKASTECNEKQACKRAIRKRREAPQRSCRDGAKSPQQATDELKAYEGQFAVDSYNDTSMLKKSQFLTAAKTLIPKICRNLRVESAPAQAVSTLAGLVVQRQACDRNNSTLSNVSCEGCFEIAKFRIKENLLENNSQWNCSQNNHSCDGVCIGSLRMPNDLMSNYSTGCRSHVIHVQMFNPKTAKPVAVNSPGEVMSVEVQFNEDRPKTNNSDYKCFMWQPDAGRWDDSVCNLTILERRSNQPFVSQCNCTRLGTVCVAFSTTDMNNPASASSGGSSSGGRTTASAGDEGATTASSGGSSGSGPATTASSGGSSGSGPATTASSGGSTSGDAQWTTASSGGSTSGDAQSTTASSGGGQSTTASSGGRQTTTASPGGSEGNADTSGTVYVSLKLAGDNCNSVVGTANEQPFLTAAKTKLQETFHWRQDQVYNLQIKCGSIVLSFSIIKLDPAVVKYSITNIGQITISNFTISLPDGRTFTVFQALVGYDPGNVTIFTTPVPTLPPTTGKRYELVFDYTPIMATVALGIALVMLCVCCTCIVHSWYLRKEKYTEYNSMTIKEYEEKMRAKNKNEFPMTEMEPDQKAVAHPRTTNFDMTNEQMPQINERSLANYDWARTSYLPGMLAQPSGVDNEDAPRLILDEDSDSDSETREGEGEGEGEGEDNEGFQKSTLDIAKSTSHLSLDNLNPNESNDSLSQNNTEAPPVYDDLNYDIPDRNSTESPEPEYSTIQ